MLSTFIVILQFKNGLTKLRSQILGLSNIKKLSYKSHLITTEKSALYDLFLLKSRFPEKAILII